jgi:IS30 family transposase
MHKGKTFLQLSEGERYQIEVLLNAGSSLSAIAKALNRSVSTVSREVRRNSLVKYKANMAQRQAERRHRFKPKRRVFDQAMQNFICKNLQKERLSPELISVKGRQIRCDFISYEWIYQWIWRMKFSQAKADRRYNHLYEYLRHAYRRRKRSRQRHNRGNILERTWIDQRPPRVDQRMRSGDLEADIMLGKDRKPGLLVALDRKTRMTWIRRLKNKDSRYVIGKLKQICRQIGNVRTITLDNDQSFAEHYKLNAMGIKTFFTHPYSSQEKGSVENRIGLIRIFFPKQSVFSEVSDQRVKSVQNMINNRPLRMFDYKSPKEIYIAYPIKLKT